MAGSIESFNWSNQDAPFHLASMDYTACIRQGINLLFY
jgi:hypothetical protein